MHHEILGEGTYGCVIKPSLKCKSKKKIDYSGRVSKVMRKKDAADEMNEMNKFKHLTDLEKYSIRTPIKCGIDINDDSIKIISKCENKRVTRVYKKDPSKLSQLLIDDGGVDLYRFSETIYPNLSLDDQKIFFTSILHLFKGLKYFSDNDIIHQDIKSLNIVYNVSTGKIRYIDFGMVISKNEFIQQSKESSYSFAQSWAYYPPEFSCANKNDYNSRRMKCVVLKQKYKNYDNFITDMANSFDSYCLSYDITNLISTIYVSKGNKIDKKFLKSLNRLMEQYSNKDMNKRDFDLDKLISTYTTMLNEFNIYTQSDPRPPPEVLENASKLSVELKNDNKEIKCPPSLPDFNPFTKKCVRKCNDGKVRNDKFRCVKTRKNNSPKKVNQNDMVTITISSDKIENKPRKCPPSLPDYNSFTKKCVRKCNDGKVRNDKFRCVKTRKNNSSDKRDVK
jgi:serine/threonine protein kinase